MSPTRRAICVALVPGSSRAKERIAARDVSSGRGRNAIRSQEGHAEGWLGRNLPADGNDDNLDLSRAHATLRMATPATQRQWPASAKVDFQDLVVKREAGRPPILGCVAASWWLEVDELTLQAIRAIEGSPSIEAAHARLIAELGEELDLEGLLDMLGDRGFIRAVDGHPWGATPPKASLAARILDHVPTNALQWVKRPIVPIAILAFAAIAVFLMAREPILLPSFRSLRVFSRPSLSLIVTFFGGLFIAALHEAGHYLVARSYGIRPKLRLSHRFYFLVLETDVTDAWSLRPTERLRIFLAGIAVNLTLLCAAVLGATLILRGTWDAHPLVFPFLRLAIFLNAFPVIFQLFFFARTDLYYVLALALNERRLSGDARGCVEMYARHAYFRARGHSADACEACGGSTFPHEPFCLRCGAARRVEDPNKYPFGFASRRRLLAFGILLFVGQAVGLYFVFRLVLSFQALYLLSAGGRLYYLIVDGSRSGGAIAENAFVLVIVALQFFGILFFIGRDIGGMVLRAARGLLSRLQKRTRAPSHEPTSPQENI